MNSPARKFGILGFIAATVACVGAPMIAAAAETETSSPAFAQDDLDFFERKIRPILVEHCYECHSQQAAKAKRLKGGLRVDTREGLLRGGDSGPAVVEKDSAASLLIQALKYETFEMPPRGKLPANVIADFERWIERGAADPRQAEAAPATTPIPAARAGGKEHWAAPPGRHTPVPDVEPAADSMIDVYLTAKRQAQGLPAGVEADRMTLIRRVSFDLVGLPPEPEEIAEFLADDAPDAWERLIDRLLASPRFGERWGRHWLSVARFGESLTLRGFVLPEAWRYRDYVIEAFNADLPFDRFVIEQIAGDLLPAESLADRQRQLVATTYLTLGNLNLEEQDKRQLRMDVVDEQLDAIGKGFLAQTIGCARCHDHKFDPIPTRDYYALAGILANVQTLEDANVSKWLEFPLPVEPELEAIYARQEAAVAALQVRIASVQKAQRDLMGVNIVSVKNLPGVVIDDQQAKVVGQWDRSSSVKPYVGEGYLHDRNDGKGAKTVTFLAELPKAGRYDVRLAYTPADNRSDAVPVTVFSADGEKTVIVNQRKRPAIDGVFVSLGSYRFELNGQSFVLVSTEGTAGHVVVDAVQFLPVDAEIPSGSPPESPTTPTPDAAEEARLAAELKSLQQELKALQADGLRRAKYMSVREHETVADLPIHIRGTVHNLGQTVPRGFLNVAVYEGAPQPSAMQSGRLELGQWIASPRNPLTSRVMANRVWGWLFGEGLSRTPDNFGTTGDRPSHPELLDRLALRLTEREWHVKPLVREIVQSGSYRLASSPTPAQRGADPENRWLSHQNRRRLDAECLLDAILTVSGNRDDTMYGSTIPPAVTYDYGYVHRSRRRAVYWPVFRNSLPEIFEAFDFADPSLPSGSRNVSTVAPQALFFLNDDWVAEQAKLAAERLLADDVPDDSARIERLFRIVLGRSPSLREIELANEAALADHSTGEAWERLVQALLASIDFRYVE